MNFAEKLKMNNKIKRFEKSCELKPEDILNEDVNMHRIPFYQHQ